MAIFWYLFFIGSYVIYSYAHTDPNIVYSYHPIFMSFQKQMWHLGMEEKTLSTLLYGAIVVGLFSAYKKILLTIATNNIATKKLTKIAVTAISLLIIANPALSHDIYNYIFNARMVAVYQTNPHTHTALEFPDDSWTRYMRNTHTSAPYGYGWTSLSLLPYALGFGSLKLTMIAFKGLMVISFAALVFFQKKLLAEYKNAKASVALWAFILNPLVLIETFGNGHNDVVMMSLAMCSLWLFSLFSKNKRLYILVLASLALALSVSIKYASILLLIGMGISYIAKKLQWSLNFGSNNALLLSLPLMTTRSQQFLPWYLIWSLSFLPFIQKKLAFNLLVIFSLSSMLRYLPEIFLPTFNRPISDITLRLIEIAITFSLPILYVLYHHYSVGLIKPVKT